MNLFCFSLEGSMDSLYEPVQEPHDALGYTVHSRPSSPAAHPEEMPTWGGPERSISLDFSQSRSMGLKKKKRKTPIQKSVSQNESLDNTECNTLLWKTSTKKGNGLSSHGKNCLHEDLVEDYFLADFLNAEDRVKESQAQVLSYDAWIPNWDHSDSKQQQHEMAAVADEEETESRGTLKRLQKLVRVKRSSLCSPDEEDKNTAVTSTRVQDAVFVEDSPVLSCIKLLKNQEKKQSKAEPPPRQSQDNEPSAEFTWNSLDRTYRPGWSNPTEYPLPWHHSYHTCQRIIPEHRVYGYDFTLPRSKDWDQAECCAHDPALPRAPRSATDVDLWDSKRSSSFGRFDAFRQHSSAQPAPEDNSESSAAEGECEAEACDQSHNKPSSNTSIGKKMRAISLTMRRKMGRKYSKAFTEEMGEDTERDCETHEGDHRHGQHSEKASMKASDSMESLYSGRSSSSGVTSGSDGSSNRDSIRLEEDVPYCGPFCGSCRVHTDFIPSPYDSDSLKLKKGDVIEIISKPPMGTWTGMLHNKVGSFKFIYVDMILQKEEVEQERKIRPHRRSKRPRPKTLLEMLERLDLKEYASSLLLNGYQTVDDLKDLKEKHLIELNVSDPEHRARLLAAIENLAGIEHDNEQESEQLQVPQTLGSNLRLEPSHLNECPRDSGCYITSESSDNGREELDREPLPGLQRNPLQCPDSTLHDLSGD